MYKAMIPMADNGLQSSVTDAHRKFYFKMYKFAEFNFS